MIKKVFLALLIVVLTCGGNAEAQQKKTSAKNKKGQTTEVAKKDTVPAVVEPQRDPVPMPLASADSLLKHVMELSSETYMGRLSGSEGYDKAARYVANTLSRYGVDLQKGKLGQKFEVECNEVENCKFNIYLPGNMDKRVFTLGNEFCCAGVTGRGYVDARMVFCGYGIDNKYFDEYAKIDVKGQIAVVLTGMPEATLVPESIASQYQSLRDKARTAQKHGAIGMIAINVSRSCRDDEPQGRIYCGELPHLATFPILQVTRTCADEMFLDERMAWDSAMVRIERERKPQSFSLLKKAEIDVNARYSQRAKTTNIVGILEGKDKLLKHEYIVIGASLDGAGMQGETCLFPSADINATGVAAVLEAARVLSNPDYRPKRSVVFVLFGASEQQYLGSRKFVSQFEHLRRIEAFVNVQNIGSGDSLVILGDKRYPTLWDIAYARDTMGEQMVAPNSEKTRPRGDAVAFDAISIPSIVITTLSGMQHNHVSSDIWENVDRRIMTLASQLAIETVCELGEGLYQGRSPRSRVLRLED